MHASPLKADPSYFNVPRRYFFCGSFMVLFCLVFAMSVRVCLYVLSGHLLGKG